MSNDPLAKMAASRRGERPARRTELPSERTGVIYLPRSNNFLCNGAGCVHPADMRAGFYYPLSRTQIKQLRRAAAKHERKARAHGKGQEWGFPGVFVPAYAASTAAFFSHLKEARKARKQLRKEKRAQARANYSEPINLRHILSDHTFALRQAKENRRARNYYLYGQSS